MNPDSLFGLAFALALAIWASILLFCSGWKFRRMLVIGLWVRVFASIGYLSLFNVLYGKGDYLVYFRDGLQLRDALGTAAGGELWFNSKWWAGPFVDKLTALVLSVIGASLPGAFIIFAGISYIGTVALAIAFMRAFPLLDHKRYLLWILFFPSLVFWPASLGKDALVLCGIGLTTLGFVGRRSPNWALLIFGLAVVFIIRPQVAALLGFSAVSAHWFGAARRWTAGHIAQGIALVTVGVAIIVVSGLLLRVEFFDPSQAQAYLGSHASMSARGGSSIATGGAPSLLMGPIDTLMRPFPWDPGGVLSLVASLEVMGLWAVGLYRRREVKVFFSASNRNRLTWLALIFVAMYASALGMAISNMGILARQRVHILPFVFMFLVAVPARKRIRGRSGRRERTTRGIPGPGALETFPVAPGTA